MEKKNVEKMNNQKRTLRLGILRRNRQTRIFISAENREAINQNLFATGRTDGRVYGFLIFVLFIKR